MVSSSTSPVLNPIDHLFQKWVRSIRPLPIYRNKIDIEGRARLNAYEVYYQEIFDGKVTFEVPVLRFSYDKEESRWVVSSYDVMGNWVRISAASTLPPLFIRLPVAQTLDCLNLKQRPIDYIEATLWIGKDTFVSGYVNTPFDQGPLWRVYLNKGSKDKYFQIAHGDFKKVKMKVVYR
ncbi:hypothetical protein BCT54_16350 [Vibrio splendidus]|uniref:Uncharacterized protein n=1 Tax=Vibrio splendidus TaxID=29497 RepID=A0A2N7JYV9_VIBSP|nr:hypothetical protein BCT54_16350 [Vibrio splendidus]